MDPSVVTASQIISSCQVLQNGTLKDIREAENYLSKVQQSPDSWPILFDILGMDDLQVEIYVMVANLLKQKFQFDFYQLSQAEYWNMAQLLVSKP